MAQNYDERLQKLREKKEQLKKQEQQLKAQEQALLNRIQEKERKERTHRLIQNGALAEKYLNCEGMKPEEFEKILLDISTKLKSYS